MKLITTLLLTIKADKGQLHQGTVTKEKQRFSIEEFIQDAAV